jgi:shikimate kinase
MAGVGKSTIGKLLARAMGFTFIDVDEYILEKDGKKIQEIIDDESEDALVQLESKRIYEIDLHGKVVAPGGSIIYSVELMDYLKQNTTLVYLDDSFERIEKKLTNASVRGIVGLKNKPLKQVYLERSRLYPEYADITVDCSGGESEDEIVEQILGCLADIKK